MQLGTVRDLARYNPDTDQTAIVTHLMYDAFGRVPGQSNPAVTTLFAFTGRPLDPATGLQNHLHRWYDSRIGRWLSEDPLGFAADANPYRYCFNTSTTGRDLTGLGFWGNYWFYLWHPSRQDRDIRIGQDWQSALRAWAEAQQVAWLPRVWKD